MNCLGIYIQLFSVFFIFYSLLHNPGIEAKPPSSMSCDWLLTSSFFIKVCSRRILTNISCLKAPAEVTPISEQVHATRAGRVN